MVLESAAKLFAGGKGKVPDVCHFVVKSTFGWIHAVARQLWYSTLPDPQSEQLSLVCWLHDLVSLTLSPQQLYRENVLPSAATCFNELLLPSFPSYEDLRHKLLTAISEGAGHFGLA